MTTTPITLGALPVGAAFRWTQGAPILIAGRSTDGQHRAVSDTTSVVFPCKPWLRVLPLTTGECWAWALECRGHAATTDQAADAALDASLHTAAHAYNARHAHAAAPTEATYQAALQALDANRVACAAAALAEAAALTASRAELLAEYAVHVVSTLFPADGAHCPLCAEDALFPLPNGCLCCKACGQEYTTHPERGLVFHLSAAPEVQP